MDVADATNDVIDIVADLEIHEIKTVLTTKALLAICGTISGPIALILTPLINIVLDKCGIYEAMRLGKRNFQLRIDLVDSHMVLRSMDKAIESGDIDDIKKAFSDY